MASSSLSSLLGSSDETFNGTKLMRLILDGGTEALRNALLKTHPGNLQVVLSCTCSSSTSTCNYHILSKLRTRKIINQNQWDKLYSVSPNQPNINDFDITLLSVLLRNICGLSPPPSGWDNFPNASDHSVEADIVRIRLFRNDRFGHIAKSAVSTADFTTFWAEISSPLVRLGIDQKEIDRLEKEECGKEEVERILKEWNNKVMNVLNDIKDNVNVLVKKDEELRSDGVLKKHLVRCDFQKEIEFYNAKFTNGTREWVFEQLLTWFNDETSENRAFVISCVAGMGKSVIAAVICKRFAEHVGASHFFQYNNSQYNNPIVLLQSLAWQLCNVVPAYKEALIEKLSGNLGKSLNNMNIEGLFSVLFKEPFSGIPGSRKRILVVLDAVDESEFLGKHELAFLISNHLHKLPSYIRFVVTTRPEKNLLDKFIKLNPLYIDSNDERNLNDIKLVLEGSLKGVVDSLAQKCEGLMLYAFFLCEIYKNESCMHRIDSLPKGIEEYYERCFRRLERDLSLPGDTFLSFLSVLAVASEPLPEAFVGTVFGFQNSPGSRQKTRKAINSISTFLVINEDKSISFFHKSVRDWLVDNSDHDYSVDVQYGHKTLFDICVKILDELKKNGVSSEGLVTAVVKYALKHCVPHMLNGLDDTGKLEYFVSSYVTDLEVMFASVCVDIDLTMNNITTFLNHEMQIHVSESTRTALSRLFFLIRKYGSFLRNRPQTFLQNVVNEGGDGLSSKASNLLETRYKDFVYLELFNKGKRNHKFEARCFLSGTISGIDVSPHHDYLVCSYEQGGIELFSLTTGTSEWRIQDFPVILDDSHDGTCMLPHCIVFHPRENVILPGRLDKVITLLGTFTTGTFQYDEDSSVFTNCCFSLDASRMATYHGSKLFVWNVLSGAKEKYVPCKMLHSLSFTASGNFLGTTDAENVLTVYDVTNDYNIDSAIIDSEFPVEIVSTFEQHSWFCSLGPKFCVQNHDLSQSSELLHPVVNAVLPSNVHSSHDIEHFLQHPERSWLSKIMKNLHDMFGWSRDDAIRYLLIDVKSVLVFSSTSSFMYVFSIEGLIDTEEQELSMKKDIFSNISTNGDFVYVNNAMNESFTVCKLDSKYKYSKPYQQSGEFDFVVVRDGVILHGGNDTPELFNNDLTQCLARLDQLTGTRKFLYVSDEVIACVHVEGYINFFNVFTRQIVCQMIFTEDVYSVYACSIEYLVFARTKSSEISLWKDGEKVHSISWTDDFDKVRSGICTFEAAFSPEGSRLALSSVESTKIYIYDVVSEILCPKIIPISDGFLSGLNFFDNKKLLYGSSNHMLYLISIEEAEERDQILTCLDVGDSPGPISVCRERMIVCAGLHFSEHFELIKICLARNLQN